MIQRLTPLMIVIAFVGVVSAMSALADSRATTWRSNKWQTPTGSIICGYSPLSTIITCTSQRSGLSVTLGRDGLLLTLGRPV
jgi:hypothetical protein